jgi:hypothetical protein
MTLMFVITAVVMLAMCALGWRASTRVLEAASFYRSVAQDANASIINDQNFRASELQRYYEKRCSYGIIKASM